MSLRHSLLWVATVFAACSGMEPTPDSGLIDAGLFDAGHDAGTDAGVDAGVSDSGIPDAGHDAGVDAGVSDAGLHDAGLADAGHDAGCGELGATQSGTATWYTRTGNGACGPRSTTTHFASMLPGAFPAQCGACVEVTGPNGTTTVVLDDVCATCTSGIDLSQSAFAEIAPTQMGAVAVTWRPVACPTVGNITVQFQTSSTFFLRLSLSNTRYAVASVSYRPTGASAFTAMTRASSDNSWQHTPSAAVAFPVTLRTTDAFGASVDLTLPTLVNDVPLDGGAQFPSFCPP